MHGTKSPVILAKTLSINVSSSRKIKVKNKLKIINPAIIKKPSSFRYAIVVQSIRILEDANINNGLSNIKTLKVLNGPVSKYFVFLYCNSKN